MLTRRCRGRNEALRRRSEKRVNPVLNVSPVLSVSSVPEPEAQAVIGAGLNAYNDAIVGYADRVPLTVIVRDGESGAILGGISGRTSLGLLFLDTVYLPDSLRGQDIGTRMLAMAEDEGRRRGCRNGVLYTINFQAPRFYERLGWTVFGEVPCDPPGTSRVFLTKALR
jgi:GNAT superfamily N-acetyltransferase